VDLWQRGRLPIERLISSTLPLTDVNEAFDRLAAGTELRQVLDLTLEDL
jgi:alcohol dehydrogenase